ARSYRRQALRLLTCLTIATLVLTAQANTTTGASVAYLPLFAQERKPAGSSEPIELATVLVSVPVTVTDHAGRAISGLKRESFKIYEDQIEQPISFFSDEDEPASVAIVFDTSGSMSEGKIIRARETLARFIQTSHPDDEYFAISFNSTPRLLLD